MIMTYWILSLLALCSATFLSSCGPLEGGGDPLDGGGSGGPSLYYRESGESSYRDPGDF
jgi:hypothetical protein